MTDICEHARIAYQAGINPLDYAEAELTRLIGVHIELASVVRRLRSGPRRRGR